MLYTDVLTVRAATAPEFQEHHAAWIGCEYGYIRSMIDNACITRGWINEKKSVRERGD